MSYGTWWATMKGYMMHDPHHKPKTFRQNTFSRFAMKHGLSMKIQPFDRYGLIDSSKLKEARNFTVSLSRGERNVCFNITFPAYRKVHLPPIEDVLEYMANEINVHEFFKDDAAKFAAATHIPIDAAGALLQDTRLAATTYRAFFGQEVYDELWHIGEDRG